MFHSLLVFRTKGELMLERWYSETAHHRETYVAATLGATRKEWDGATVQRVAVVQGVTAVFFRLGDLAFVLSGERDYDELVCGEALRCIVELVIAQCESGKEGVNENEFLAMHDRISLAVDHVIRHGILEHTGGPALAALLNSAPETLTAAALQQRELERVSVPACALPTLVSKVGKQPKTALKAPERARATSTILVKAAKK
jgi:hypothetical protein